MRTCQLCPRPAAVIWNDCDYCWNCMTLILIGNETIRLIPQTPNPEHESIHFAGPDGQMAPGPH